MSQKNSVRRVIVEVDDELNDLVEKTQEKMQCQMKGMFIPLSAVFRIAMFEYAEKHL